MFAVKRKQEQSFIKEHEDHKKIKISRIQASNLSRKGLIPNEIETGPNGELDDSGENEFETFDNIDYNMLNSSNGKLKSKEEITKAKLSRQEQKRQMAERKSNRPMGDIIQRSKRIWEQLRRKSVIPQDRKNLIEELQCLVAGRIRDLVFRHDASRVVQTALKYGHKKARAEIAMELKGTYVDLAQSSYGKYLVVKVMHYGTPETRMVVVEEFYGHVKKLMKHREASFVIEDCFREYATTEQKVRLLKEFYGVGFAVFASANDPDPSLSKILKEFPEKRAVIMKNLLDHLKTIVEKGALFFSIVHKAMLEFLRNTTPGTTEVIEFIELIKEYVGEIVFTRDGAQVVMRCLALGNAKDRKIMLKSLKPVTTSIAMHEAAYLVLITAYDVVDDTVLVSKTFFPELQQHFGDIATHKYGRISLLYPVVGRKAKLLQPSAISLLSEMDRIRESTSKKNHHVRRSEIRTHLAPVLLHGIVEHAKALVRDSFGCQLIAEALLGVEDGPTQESLLTHYCETITGDKYTPLHAIAEMSSTGNPNDKDHFAASAAGCRMLKTLVTGGHYNYNEKKVEVIQPPLNFHQLLYKMIESNIKDWAVGSASFVVVAMLEVGVFVEIKGLKFKLKKYLEDIQKAAVRGNKGSVVILNLIG